MKRLPVITAVYVFLILICSCGSNPLDVDVSAISVPQVRVERYDKAFFSIDTTQMTKSLAALDTKFGDFHKAYINNIICRQAHDSLACDYAIRDFISSYEMKGAYDDVQQVFPGDFSWLENDLTGAYKHFKYYFPKRELPKGVYTAMTGFNYYYFQASGYYGIGLEFFLGPNHADYGALQLPAYKRRICSKEYMAAGFVKAWMTNEFPYDPPKNDVINRMIYEGKLLYLQKALLRGTPDSIITGYTQKQLDWCKENEGKMWALMIEQKKVYSDNEEDLQHFTEDAPFTADFPRESPGKAGNWLGLRIVEKYMEQNPDMTIEKLMDIKDGAGILLKSKYKPKI